MSKNVNNMFRVVSNTYEDENVSNGWCFLHFKPWKQKNWNIIINILAWFYAIFDVKIAEKRQFWPSGQLWLTRVDHMCVIWPNIFWNMKVVIPSTACRHKKKVFPTPHDEFCISGHDIWGKGTWDRYLQGSKCIWSYHTPLVNMRWP